ncbi:type II toxin-antitoxin system MqsA family antitoxin [Candidatus Nitrospira salsa]
MKCVICKHGTTQSGRVTMTLQRSEITLVIKNVPSDVCSNCGEEYVAEDTTTHLLKTAENIAHAGVEIDIREYIAA